VQEFQATDVDGRPVGEPTRRRSTWLDLQRHASDPAEGTTVDEVALTLPFGTFECWLCRVEAPGSELRFWFAKELPGMAVQVEERVGGVLAGRSQMIANQGSQTEA